MDIKDLVGLKKPITRLLEVLAYGVGAVAGPMILRKRADAKAYEIRTLSEAIEDARETIPDLQYKQGEITALNPETENDYYKRIESRIAYRE